MVCVCLPQCTCVDGDVQEAGNMQEQHHEEEVGDGGEGTGLRAQMWCLEGRAGVG